ncbi:unnamed protein product, partial [Brenthis ino]
MQNMYKSLIDFTEATKSSFDPINDPRHYVMESMTLALLLIIIFAPSIFASSLHTDVNKIKIALHDMMLDERDRNKLQDMQQFINYVDARPFKFHNDPLHYVMESVSLALFLIIIFAPSMFASSLHTDVNKIKTALHDMMLDERELKVPQINKSYDDDDVLLADSGHGGQSQ